MDGASTTVAGPQDVWVTCWFKQPGWQHDAGWQQQRMKIITRTSGGRVLLGCEDRWGNPGTNGDEDWNDLEIDIKIEELARGRREPCGGTLRAFQRFVRNLECLPAAP